jgi:hypothetical protein
MSLSAARKLMTGFGVFYVAIGVLGFVPGITQQADVAGPGTGMPGEGLLLGIFAVNVVHNVAHIALGALALWAGSSDDRLRSLATTLAAIFAVLVVGSFVAPIVEGVAINTPDTLLHLVSAALSAWVAFGTGHRVAAGSRP